LQSVSHEPSLERPYPLFERESKRGMEHGILRDGNCCVGEVKAPSASTTEE